MVVEESASGGIVAREDAMILAMPILIFAALFLGWLLVRLTVHALPLFAGVLVMLVLHHMGVGTVAAFVTGALTGVAVTAIGRTSFQRARSPAGRLAIPLVFAAPASIAAYHAASGLSSALISSGAWHVGMSVVSALLVGTAAWRGIATDRGPSRQ